LTYYIMEITANEKTRKVVNMVAMAAFVSHGRREENAFKQRSIVDHLGEREILSMYRPSTVVIHELTRMVTPALARPKKGQTPSLC